MKYLDAEHLAKLSRESISQAFVKMHLNAKQRLKRRLKDTDGISLSLGVWTNPDNKARYMAVIVHYVDKQFVHKENMFDFIRLTSDHSGIDLGDSLWKYWMNINLRTKYLRSLLIPPPII